MLFLSLVACQLLEKQRTSQPEVHDTGVYAGGVIDARPARLKMAQYAAHRLVLDQDAVHRARAVLRGLEERGGELGEWALPLLRLYLPPGVTAETRIVIDMELPRPLFVDQVRDELLVDASSPHFGGDIGKVLNESRDTINMLAMDRLLAPSLALTPARGREDWLLARLAHDGMARYLSLQGDVHLPFGPPKGGVETEGFDTLEDPWAPLSDKFMTIDVALGSLSGVSTDKAWTSTLLDLARVDAANGLFGKVGAYMAKIIERELGRQALVRAVAESPRVFFETYQTTRPGALMTFQLPSQRQSGLAH